jgi:purine-cytosine permease-like protein
MPLSRFAFGFQGAKLPALFNALACIGWSAVNAIIGSSLLVAWSAGKIPQWAALIFLAVATTAVSVFGYFIVHRYERVAWIPMFLLFDYVLITAAPHFNPHSAVSTCPFSIFGDGCTVNPVQGRKILRLRRHGGIPLGVRSNALLCL